MSETIDEIKPSTKYQGLSNLALFNVFHELLALTEKYEDGNPVNVLHFVCGRPPEMQVKLCSLDPPEREEQFFDYLEHCGNRKFAKFNYDDGEIHKQKLYVMEQCRDPRLTIPYHQLIKKIADMMDTYINVIAIMSVSLFVAVVLMVVATGKYSYNAPTLLFIARLLLFTAFGAYFSFRYRWGNPVCKEINIRWKKVPDKIKQASNMNGIFRLHRKMDAITCHTEHVSMSCELCGKVYSRMWM